MATSVSNTSVSSILAHTNVFSTIENLTYNNVLPQYSGKWFKVTFSLPNNAQNGQYQIVLSGGHRTETVYSDSSPIFYTTMFLPYEQLINCNVQLFFNSRCERGCTANINDVLPKDPNRLSYTDQYTLEMVQEGRKGPSFTFHMHFQLHLLNVAPLSSTTFDLIVDLKPASRLALFDRQDYLRVFVYATSKQYAQYIAKNPQVKVKRETIQTFQDDGYLLYITQLTEEQTKTAEFPFVEFDTALLQFASQPQQALDELTTKGQLPTKLKVLNYDEAVYLRFVLRNDRDEVLAVTQETLPAIVQPFASMQRTSSRELAPLTTHIIGSNNMQQTLIHNHHVLNEKIERHDEPSVSRRHRGSQSGSRSNSRDKSSKKSRVYDLDEKQWQPPSDHSVQSQCRVLKTPIVNPAIPQVLVEDPNLRDKSLPQVKRNVRNTNGGDDDKNDKNDGLTRRKYGPFELPLFDNPPQFYDSAKKESIQKANSKLKIKGSLYLMSLAHYHLPTMKESFNKNNVVLKPSVVLDYYSDDNRKPEIDKSLDMLQNIMIRLEDAFVYRSLPHTQAEVDDFFIQYYQQFGPQFKDLIDPEAVVDRAELQREFEPGEPYILRNLEAAGIPLTFLNVSPPPNLTPVRDLSKVSMYREKWKQLLPLIQSKYPGKPEMQRYEFNNTVKTGNNAHPDVYSPVHGINRKGIVSSDNKYHHQLSSRDGTPLDEYCCDIYDARRLHPLLQFSGANSRNISQYCDYPLTVEALIYYCRVLRHKVRSSTLLSPDDPLAQQRRVDRMNGAVYANDNNTGLGGHSTASYVEHFAREVINRTLLDLEQKVYKTNQIEYHVVFVGGFRGDEDSQALVQRFLREYLSMLPVSFIFLEYNEVTKARQEDPRKHHTNGAAPLDSNGLDSLNETGFVTTQSPKLYAVADSEHLSAPIYTYDRRNIKKLQHEYLYPQRDIIISLKETWFSDATGGDEEDMPTSKRSKKDTVQLVNKALDYDRVVIPRLKARLAIQIKQYLDIQFKSRATFETMSTILYPSMSGVQCPFALQTAKPMKLHTTCGLYRIFFESNDNIFNDGSTQLGTFGDEKKAHRVPTFDEETNYKTHHKCPECEVYDTTFDEAVTKLFHTSKQESDMNRERLAARLLKQHSEGSITHTTSSQDGLLLLSIAQQTGKDVSMFNGALNHEYTVSITQEDPLNNTFTLVGTTTANELPPPYMDDIVDTSKFNIKLDSTIASQATVRDITSAMQYHIETLALKIAQFKEEQGI